MNGYPKKVETERCKGRTIPRQTTSTMREVLAYSATWFAGRNPVAGSVKFQRNTILSFAVWSQHRGAQHNLRFPHAAFRTVRASLPSTGPTIAFERSEGDELPAIDARAIALRPFGATCRTPPRQVAGRQATLTWANTLTAAGASARCWSSRRWVTRGRRPTRVASAGSSWTK